MQKLTFFLSPSKMTGKAYELTVSKKGSIDRGIVTVFPEQPGRTIQEVTQNAMGHALIKALQSRHDYGNQVELVIEFEICSIVDPVIKI